MFVHYSFFVINPLIVYAYKSPKNMQLLNDTAVFEMRTLKEQDFLEQPSGCP